MQNTVDKNGQLNVLQNKAMPVMNQFGNMKNYSNIQVSKENFCNKENGLTE